MGLFSFFKKKPPVSVIESSQCCICLKILSGRVAQDAWANSAHDYHHLVFCYSCHRIISRHTSAGSYQYSDGRAICGLCKKVAITDSIAVNRSKRKVLALLEAVGFQDIPKNIEIVLSGLHDLSSHSRKRNTAGLTLSHVHFSNNKRVGLTHQIGVLYGLPQIEFEAVLAHELLHVWQNEKEFKFSPLYNEGLCELGSFLIYSNDPSDLAKFLIKRMSESKDPVYGNGFRLMLNKLQALGWKRLMADLLKNKKGYESSVLRKIFGR
ncbi:MAG: protein DA1 [Deltaproteobacteria bacterium]|nr:protein DA1 [Deltaproteobacteria bacterium]